METILYLFTFEDHLHIFYNTLWNSDILSIFLDLVNVDEKFIFAQ